MYKRYELRRTAYVPMEVISARSDLPMLFTTADLSPGGAYVTSEIAPPIGEHLVCSFDLGLARELCFFGEVSRINLGRRMHDRGPLGFGIRFLDAGPRERLSIRRMLRGLPPPAPSPRRSNALTRAMGWA